MTRLGVVGGMLVVLGLLIGLAYVLAERAGLLG